MRLLKCFAAVLVICAFSLVNVTALSFIDVPTNHSFYNEIIWAANEGLVEGSNGNFRPNDNLTEGQFVIILCRFTGISPVPGQYSHYAQGYYNAVRPYALPLSGYDNNAQKNAVITRGQIARILAAKSGFNLNMEQAVYYMYENGLSNGTQANSKTYSSYGKDMPFTRGQTAAFFKRLDAKGTTSFKGIKSSGGARDMKGIAGIPASTEKVDFSIFNPTSSTAAKPNVKLPAGFPTDIPLASDAFNAQGKRDEGLNQMTFQYQSNQKMSDVSAMYRNFLKKFPVQVLDFSDASTTTLSARLPDYDFALVVYNIGYTNVVITLTYPDSLPEATEPQTQDQGSSTSTSTIETNQSRLKLPAFLPEEIPFTKDAVLSLVDDKSYAYAGDQMITLTYSSQTARSQVVSIYQNFTRAAAGKNNEMDLGSSYSFNSSFNGYDLIISVSDGYSSTAKTTVTMVVNPTDGVFQNHYTITDYSTGSVDSSGVKNPNNITYKRLVAGPRLTDPYTTQISLRKNDNSLWFHAYDLYAGVRENYGRWDAYQMENYKWNLVDKDAYCADTEADCYYLIKPDSSLWAYGDNYNYLIGNGNINQNADYPPVKLLDNVRTADIGKNGSAVTKDNSLWIWGTSSGLFTVLNNPDEDRLAPVKVMDQVVDARQSGSVGWDYGGLIMVLKTDGSLWTWGEGNCGDGGVTRYRKTPIKIMNGVKAIAASNSLCCVIKNDNSLWVWEAHITGTRNDNLKKPVKIMDNVKMVSPGERFLVALKNDGTVWTYGNNTYGECGIGNLTTTYLSTPRKILDGVSEVTATDHNAFALMQSGKVLGWGINDRTSRPGDYDWLNTTEWKITKPADIGFGVN